jgi:hypothetical protein
MVRLATSCVRWWSAWALDSRKHRTLQERARRRARATSRAYELRHGLRQWRAGLDALACAGTAPADAFGAALAGDFGGDESAAASYACAKLTSRRGVLELCGHVVLGLVGQAQGQDEHLVVEGEWRWGAECERAARGKREDEKGRVQIAGDANERH